MPVCTCIAQDHTHLTQVLSHRPIAHCPLEGWLLFRSPLCLSLGMADGASSDEDSLDDNSDLIRTRTATGHTKCLDDDSDLGPTRTATGHRKRKIVAQKKERLVAERLRHIPSIITSSYYTYSYLSVFIICESRQ